MCARPFGVQGKPLTIASLWIGQTWSFLEQVVVQSYLDAGHDFVLFGDVRPPSLPAEVTFRHYAEIVTPPFAVGAGLYHNNGVFSDLFRLLLIRDLGYCWVDMDAYCIRPFDFAQDSYVMAPEVGDEPLPYVATGVLHLPRSSPSLDASIALFFAAAAAVVVDIGAVLNVDADFGDPTRSLHAIMTGIGFLGAGLIFSSKRGGVKGITTAATVFATAAMGIAVGLGFQLVAGAMTIIIIVILRSTHMIDKALYSSDESDYID